MKWLEPLKFTWFSTLLQEKEAIEKINELVDIVNELQVRVVQIMPELTLSERSKADEPGTDPRD